MIEPMWIAYVAGFFDGEGSVVIYGAKSRRGQVTPDYRVSVSISQRAKDRAVLDQIVSSFGGTVWERQRGPRTARQGDWRVDRVEDVRRFLEAIRPYARIKRPQVELALEYLATRTLARVVPLRDEGGRVKGMQPVSPEEIELRASFRRRMQELNRVGPPPAAARDA